MNKTFRWRCLAPDEIAQKGDYWAQSGSTVRHWIGPIDGLKSGSHYIGRSVQENRIANAIQGYNLWRCIDNERPRRLPMNPIFSRPLPLP